MALIAEVCSAITPLEVYGSLPQFEDAAIAPSGEKIAVVTSIRGKRQLVVVDTDSRPLLAFDIQNHKLDGIEWGDNNTVLIHLRATAHLSVEFEAEKAEIFSTVAVPLNGEKPRLIFENNHEIIGGVRGHYGTAQRNGRSYGYFSATTMVLGDGAQYYIDTMLPDLYEVDLESRKIKLISKHSGKESGWRTWMVDSTGEVAASLELISKTGAWTITNGKGDMLASGKQLVGDVQMLAFGPDGASLIYRVYDGSIGGDSLFQVPLAGGASKAVLPNEDIRRLFIDRRRRLIGFQPAGPWEPEYFGARPQQVMADVEKALSGKVVRFIDADEAWQKLIVRTDGPGDTGTWWLVDMKQNQVRPLGHSYAVPSDELGPIKVVDYHAADGLSLQGILTLPPRKAASKLPVLILPHGGPADRDYAEFDWMAQAFAARGYAVFQPNFRGSTGYGAEFRRAGFGQWGQAIQTDISDGLAELARRGIVDPKRACIMGASFGGYAALAGVTLQTGLYRCAVSIGGVSDLVALYNLEVRNSGRDWAIIRNMRNEIGALSDLKKLSPIQFVKNVTVPVLLIHGTDDTVVNYLQSKRMLAAMRAANKEVEMVTLAGEDHWLSITEARNSMLKSAMDFLLRHNPPDKME